MKCILVIYTYLGGVIGSFGVYFTDANSFLINFLFSKQNLLEDNYLFTGEFGKFLNICINDNENNNQTLLPSTGLLTNLDKLLVLTTDSDKIDPASFSFSPNSSVSALSNFD